MRTAIAFESAGVQRSDLLSVSICNAGNGTIRSLHKNRRADESLKKASAEFRRRHTM